MIIIRGPLGIGKSTIAKGLAKVLESEYLSMDEIIDSNGLNNNKAKDGGISEKSFLKADEILLPLAQNKLSKGKVVIIDGNFYRKSQIEDLKSKINTKSYIFTLKAPLETCIERDSKRKRVYGKDAAQAVYNLVSKFDYGFNINTDNKTKEQVIEEIFSNLPKE